MIDFTQHMEIFYTTYDINVNNICKILYNI